MYGGIKITFDLKIDNNKSERQKYIDILIIYKKSEISHSRKNRRKI